MATTDFQSATNLLQRVIDTIDLESRSLGTAKLAVIISVVVALLSVLSFAAAVTANIRVEYQDEKITQLTDQIDTYKNKVTRYQSTLYARGVPVEDIENDGTDD